MANTFSATVADWARESQEIVEAIFKESTQRVTEEMLKPKGAGGSMPIDTGFLRASLMASTTMMPTLSRKGQKDVSYAYDAGPVNLVIAGAEMGDTIYLGFTAVYARSSNYKHGNMFVEKAAQKWAFIVNQTEQELAAKAGLQ